MAKRIEEVPFLGSNLQTEGILMVKILVVDDEPDILYLVNKVLSNKGYTVIKASSGLDAIDKVKKEKPDLVLLDVMMPEMDGWETCKIIRADDETKDTPIAMLTVKSTDKD
ncbi:MAG: response regulator, partial [Candidatus Hydrothermarchaeales archaeon]